MKPMLAAAAPKILRFPLLASPKLDGIRCLVIDGVAVGRSLKPLPNKHVQKLFGKTSLNGLDGELVVGSITAPDVFTKTSSGVMSFDGAPDVWFMVFDEVNSSTPFSRRLDNASRRAGKDTRCLAVGHEMVFTPDELDTFEQKCLAAGYEGVMLRDPEGLYKYGRSTAREGGLLKLKRFTDGEAIIIGATELMHNGNEAKRNALGQLERSSHKAGKTGRGMLGSLVVKDTVSGVVFEIGTGFTQDARCTLWRDWIRGVLLNRMAKYKSQPSGAKDKPRFPVFLGFRDPIDL